MRPETNRWLLRAAWAIAVALWAVAVWMWFDIREATVPAPRAAAPPMQSVAGDDDTKPPPVFTPERLRRSPPGTEAAGGPGLPATAVLPTSRAATDAAVCGFDGAADNSREAEAWLARQRQAALQRAVEALHARGDTASQAAAALLEMSRRREPPAALDCRPGADCEPRGRPAEAAAVAASSPQAAERLFEIARASDDPWVLQLGLLGCDVQSAASRACSVAPRRLTSVDADNAAAWLELAARESSAAEEALFRASQAPRFESRASALAQRVDDALGAATPPLQRWLAIEQAATLGGSAAVTAAAAAGRYCSDSGVRDANRAQVCERLARLLLRAGRDVAEMQLGHGIGARLGWPEEARPSVRDELRAGAEALRLARGEAPYACAAIELQLAHGREARRSGDLAAARSAIQRSGLSVAELLASAEARAPSRAPAPGQAAASAPSPR